jgi:hypothetical protein
MIRVLILCLLVTSPAFAGEPTPIACAGPFARDSSHDRLVAAFGTQNVAFGKVDGPESSEHEATILFGSDPERRLEVTWREKTRARPDVVSFSGKGWLAPQGIRMGTSLDAMIRLNGRPFRISGFGWDNAGLTAFPRGRLATLPGGCRITVRFAPGVPEPLGRRFAPIMGNREVRSDHSLMRAARPTVVEVFLSYPEPAR